MTEKLCAIAMAFPLALFSQTDIPPSFEVASIKLATPSSDGRNHSRYSIDSQRLIDTNVSIRDLLEQAYQVQSDQIVGPPRLGDTRFDITAKIPSGISKDYVPQMLQALLADRFGVTLHRDTKEMTRYSLGIAAGGSKLKKAESSSGGTRNFGRTSNQVSARITMTALASLLSEQLGRPVINETKLEGPWEIALEWAPDSVPGGISLPAAVEDQLGLKLTSGKGPVEILIVDHAEKLPTDN
jgi:uncharacterized protein (TIGR03435 family)